MEGARGIGGLATIIASSGIAPTKTATQAQNNAHLLHAAQTGQILRGVVKSRGVQGSVTIQTLEGASLTIQTDVFLKRGAQVAFKVEQRASEALIRIVSVEGQSLNNYLDALDASTSRQPRDDVSSSSTLIREYTSHAAAQSVIRGVLLSVLHMSAQQLEALPPPLQAAAMSAQPGESVQLTVRHIFLPNPNGAGYTPLAGDAASAMVQTGDVGAPTHYTNAAHKMAATQMHVPSGDAPTATPPKPAMGSEVSGVSSKPVPAVAPRQTPPSQTSTGSATVNATVGASPAAPSASVFSATVLPSAHPRELTLHSAIATFKLFVNTPLPEGSLIQFELHHIGQVRAQDIPLQMPQHFNAMKALEGMHHTPHPHSVHSQAHPVPSLLPQPGANLSAEMLFLMTALGKGDMRRWLGQEALARVQETAGAPFLSRLAEEFAALKSPPPTRDGQWHHFLMPMFAQGTLQPMQFYVKRQRQHDASEGERDTDHFMVDIELSAIGRMQLDGLVQKHHAATQFDLMIRTQQPVNDDMQTAIRDIYQRARDGLGFVGTLHFRHGSDAFVIITVDNDDAQTSNTRSIIV